MTTELARKIDSNPRETAGLEDQAEIGVEYPVQLAFEREPVMRLAGTISVIRQGRRDLALSDVEWQDLEPPELSELAGSVDDVDGGDGAYGK
jgi:hypothetical protein